MLQRWRWAADNVQTEDDSIKWRLYADCRRRHYKDVWDIQLRRVERRRNCQV